MNYISTNWMDLSASSNILTHTYINGFIDVSNNIAGRENMFIQNKENMFGLGTIDPSNSLHVFTNNPIIHFKREQIAGPNTLVGKMSFISPIRNNVASASMRCEIVQNNPSLIFATGGGASVPNDSVIISSNGNVGIGTNTIYDKLHVNGNIYLGSSNSNERIYCGEDLHITSDRGINLAADLNDTSGSVSGGSILYYIGDSIKLFISNSTKRVTIGSGVNTTSSTLYVNGSLATGSDFVLVEDDLDRYQKTKTVANSGWSIINAGTSTANFYKHNSVYVTIDRGLWVLEAYIRAQSNKAEERELYTFGVSMGTNSSADNIARQQVHNENNDHMLTTSLGWESAVQRERITHVYRHTASYSVTIYMGYYVTASTTNIRMAGGIKATRIMDLY